MADEVSKGDANRRRTVFGVGSDASQDIIIFRFDPTSKRLLVDVLGPIADGVDSAIKATVLDYANSNPLAVRLTDTAGDYVGAGAGTQYAVDAALGATPTGTLAIAIRDDALSALTPVEGDAIGLRVDANGALWVLDSNSGAIKTALEIIDNFISGSRGLVTEDSAAAIKTAVEAMNTALQTTGITQTQLAAIQTAVQVIDNFISGSRGLVTEDNSAAIKTAVELIDDIIAVAHDAADSGNPLKIGGRADTTFQAAVADGDRIDALFDVYGVQEVRTDHPNKWSYHSNGSSALTDATVKAAPGVGLSVYITDIIVSTGAATAMNVFFEEGATKILGPYYLEAIAGRGLIIKLSTPKKVTVNTAVTVTTSAAIAQAVDVMGFIAP